MLTYHRKKLQMEPFFKYEPWTVTERRFSIEHNHHHESIFSIGNGYMGTRGTLEEDYTGPKGTSTPGIYINGVYASEWIIYGEEAPQQPEKSQTILNLANWLKINLYIDDDKFNMLEGEIEEYSRVLDLKNGTLNRSLIWTSPSGKKVSINIQRFLSLTDIHNGLINYNVKALNFSGKIKLVSELDGDVRNHFHLRAPYTLKVIDRGFEGETGYLIQKTESTSISIGMAMVHELSVQEGSPLRKLQLCENKRVIQEYEITVKEGQSISLIKYASFFTNRGVEEIDLKEVTIETAKKAREAGYNKLLSRHIDYLKQYWDDVDVLIEGDLSLQQAFRFNALQLLQSTGRGGVTTTAAKGLTGESYEGHFFWDTEMYVMPFFLYSRPEIARDLLLYRYNTLPEARENARRVRVDGALYPWRTINGQEASAFFMGSTVQFHINADIAYAIYQYFTATEDYDFLFNYGVEILVETARMWVTRGSYIMLRDNKYCFNEVCGPDEYKPGVSNNCYTNYMAKFNLEYAAQVLAMLREKDPGKYQQFMDNHQIEEGEIAKWKKIAQDIYLPYNEMLGIHPQDDSFLEKDPIDINLIPENEFPLVHSWHPLAIWRYQVIKQADVILLMFLLGDQFTREQKKANYDFYEPKTTHDSSLSPSIYSIIASEIGYYEDAYNYFIQTARLDLDDFNKNTYKGLHLACLGSTWMALVFGFAGMRTYNGKLSFNPYLPDKWQSYSFRLRFKGRGLKITVNKESVFYQLLEGNELSIVHQGQELLIDNQGREIKT